jgi:ABC-type transport system substrate-binding protein
MRRRSILVSCCLAAATCLAPLAAPAATSLPKAGATCRRSDVGKTIAGLMCRTSGTTTRWVKVASPTTPKPVTTAAPTTATATAKPEAAGPKRGGRMVYGYESEVVAGFTPQVAILGQKTIVVRTSMIETVTQPSSDGEVHCFLCESLTPNSSYTEWTMKVRPGITFHDGTPCDGAAVKFNLDEARKPTSATASFLRPITAIDLVDPMTLRIRTDGPWISLPASLSQQGGAIVAPSQVRDPNGRNRPVGTGPFKLKEWVLNDHLTVVRNESYWRKGLPYLDEIVFRPIEEEASRVAALRAGDIDGMSSENGHTVAQLRDLASDAKLKMIEYERFPTVRVIVLNSATSPTSDVRVRRAIQLATDRQQINKVSHGGVLKLGDPAFGRTDTADANLWPAVDVNKAKDLVDQVTRSTGKPVEMTLTVGTNADAIQQAELFQSMWTKAGIATKITPSDTINTSLQRGQFLAIDSSFVSSVDTDELRRYLYGDGVPVGQLSSNWGRISSGIIDSALDQIHGNSDPVVRARATQVIAREITDQAYVIPTVQVLRVLATNPKHAFAEAVLPDGDPWWQMPSGMPPFAFAYHA